MHLTLPLCSMGWCFFSPVSLLVRTTAGISLSQFFILQAIMATMVLLTEIPLGKLTDRIGYKSTLVLYQIALLISRTCLLLAHVSCNYSLFYFYRLSSKAQRLSFFFWDAERLYFILCFSKDITLKKSAHVAIMELSEFFCQYPSLCGPVHADLASRVCFWQRLPQTLVAVFTSFKNPQGNSAAQK